MPVAFSNPTDHESGEDKREIGDTGFYTHLLYAFHTGEQIGYYTGGQRDNETAPDADYAAYDD